MNLLKCENLKMGYDGKAIFEDLTFSVEKGSFLFVLGENGSGKSTLIKGILGLLHPISGKFHWEGISRNEIAYLSQTTEVKKEFPASVGEIVLSGRLTSKRFSPFYSKKDREKANESMKYMSVEDLEHRSFSELSGGQQQRVLLARAISASARVLVLDEPSKGLDSKVTEELYELLSHMNKKHGITIIMVSHDMAAALKYASHILSLSDGRNKYGKTDEVLFSSEKEGKR